MLTAVQKAKQIDEWLSRVNQCMSQLPGDLSEVKMSLSGFDPDEMPEMAKHFGCRLYAPGVLDKFWLENILKTFEKNKITMSGGKMIEKNVDNKFNSWRSKYYTQNWGDKNILNPPFLYGCNTIQNKFIWNKINGYDDKMLTNGEDVDYSKKIKLHNNFELHYCSSALCYHLQDDNLESLSNRIWRYHSFGYKIKKPSFYRFIKLSLKQFKFLFQRILENLFKFNFYFIFISLKIFLKFISLEFKNYLSNKK